MPITVRHGGELGDAFAQLAMLMGANRAQVPQLPQLQTPRIDIPGGRGGGRGGIRTSGLPRGSARLTYSGPTEEERLRELAHQQAQAKRFGMDAEVERMQAEAKAEAEQLGLELSVKDKHRAATTRAAEKRILADPGFSAEEKKTAIRALKLERNNLTGTIPATTFKWPKITGANGQEYQTGTGTQWMGADGGIYTGTMDDGVPGVKVLIRPDQMPEAAQRKADAERAQDIWEAQTKQQEANNEFLQGLISEEVERPDPKNRALTIKQLRDEDEVKRIMKTYLEMTGQIKTPTRPEQDTEWIQKAADLGFTIEESDLEMGPSAGFSSAVLRTLSTQYEKWEDMPPEYQALAREAEKELKRYEASRRGR